MRGRKQSGPRYLGRGGAAAIATLAITNGLAAPTEGAAQTAGTSAATPLPQVTVTAPKQRKPRPAKRNVAQRAPVAAPAPAPTAPP
ncbi:MAG TPA: hypothetical protein VJ718_03510, partial [Candidatus Binataceae bacterium]|nr:hypothetical protein [Candidatus Binataceae bacterium]